LEEFKIYNMKILIYIFVIVTLLTSCNNSNDSSYDESSNSYNENSDYDEYENDDYEAEEQEEAFEDGTYSASVDYYNPETGYSATYTLDVEVEDNQVTIIYFPNDGYLDDDHIWPDYLDESGFVSIQGEDGKTYDIQIDY
jgi:hypothetical protein